MSGKPETKKKQNGLGDAIRREFMELTSLTKISEAMSTSFNLHELMSLLIKTVVHDIPCEKALLLVVNPVSGEYEIESTFGFEPIELDAIRNRNDQVINWVLEKSFPLLMLDELRDDVFTDPDLQSVMALPLKVTDRVIGLIELARIKPSNSFTVNDQALLSVYAAQAALAIENTRLNNAARGKIRELNKLNEIGKLLNSTLDLEQILDTIVNTFKEMINIQVAGLLLIDRDRSRLTLISSEVPPESVVEGIQRRLFRSYFLLTGSHVHPADCTVSVEVGSMYQGLIGRDDLLSHLTVPLIMKGEVMGLLSISHSEVSYFSKDNLRTLSTFASQAAMAIENARVYRDMERKIKELSILFKGNKALTSTLNLDKILNLIIGLTAHIFISEACMLTLKDDRTGQYITRASLGLDSEREKEAFLLADELSRRVIETGKRCVISDLVDHPDLNKILVGRNPRYRSVVFVPLIMKDIVVGALGAFMKRPRRINEDEVNLLYTLGSQASAAIENARLYGFMQDSYIDTITALAAAIDAKDSYTHGHSKKVMQYSVAVSEHLKLPLEERDIIKFAGLLHDIGKIGVSEMILLKKDHLTQEEREIIQTHPKLGSFIIDKVELLKSISPLTYHHHERYDGTGYPAGLKGETIPLGARILAVADAFDAMTSTRSYREAMSVDEALKELQKCSGSQFDPQVVEAFMHVIKEKGDELLEEKKSDLHSSARRLQSHGKVSKKT